MKNFSRMWFEVWTDGKHDMMAIRAEMPEGSPGLRFIWFVLSRSELYGLAYGTHSVAEDGCHKLTVMGDHWFFYDMDGIPTVEAGEMKVKFLNVELPRTFMKAAFRLCRKVWNQQREFLAKGGNKYDLTRVKIEVDRESREGACRLFGQGKGLIDLDFGYRPEETKAFWEECLLKGGSSFARSVGAVMSITRNSTWGLHQRATLRITKDLDGFNWTAIAPNGKRFYHGGIVNHGRDGEQSWSVHT